MTAALLTFANVVYTADDDPDTEFLEWLGQLSEVEELGVDIDALIDDRAEDVDPPEQEQSN
jgi:hypothetical protein